MPSDPLSRPLIEIARDLRERRASARELVEAAIARHERFGERLGKRGSHRAILVKILLLQCAVCRTGQAARGEPVLFHAACPPQLSRPGHHPSHPRPERAYDMLRRFIG